jgi:hypothetical protein
LKKMKQLEDYDWNKRDKLFDEFRKQPNWYESVYNLVRKYQLEEEYKKIPTGFYDWISPVSFVVDEISFGRHNFKWIASYLKKPRKEIAGILKDYKETIKEKVMYYVEDAVLTKDQAKLILRDIDDAILKYR